MHVNNLNPLILDLVVAGPTYDIDRLVSAFRRLDSTMGVDFPNICEQIGEDYECDIDHDQRWADLFDEADLRVRARNFVSLSSRPHLLEATERNSRWLRSSARILMTGLQVPADELTRLSKVCPNVTFALRWELADNADQPPIPVAAAGEPSGWMVFEGEMRD